MKINIQLLQVLWQNSPNRSRIPRADLPKEVLDKTDINAVLNLFATSTEFHIKVLE